MEEHIERINTHERELAKQGQAIDTLTRTVGHLSDVVQALPGQVQESIERVYSKIDENDRANRPQLKLLLAGGALLVSIFSVIITLVFSPITQRVYSLEGLQRDSVKTGHSTANDLSYLKGNYVALQTTLESHMSEPAHAEQLAKQYANQARLDQLETLVREIDLRGSRRWNSKNSPTDNKP